MQNFKKFTLGFLIFHFLFMFQTVSQSDTITRQVTYRDSMKLIEPVHKLIGQISGENVIDWEGHVPGDDAPVRVSFEVYVDPGSIDTEINAQVMLDRETNQPRVEPRWVRNDVCDQFVGVFSTRGGVEISGNLVIDISIGQPFLDSDWAVNREVPLSAFNTLLPIDVLPENLERRWDEAAYFNSRLDGTGEPIALNPAFPDLVPFELSAADIIEGVLAYFSLGATKAADTGFTVATSALSNDEEERKKQKGALRTVIEAILGNAGFELNGGLEVELELSDVKAGIEGSPTIKDNNMIVHTTCNGKLSAQPFLTFNADFFVKFEVLGVDVWSKESKIAKEKYALTDKHQVKSLYIKGAPNPVEFPLNIDAQDFTQWDLPGGAAARLGKGTTHDMDYSPNGDLIAVGTSTGAWLYDAESGEEVALLRVSAYDSGVRDVRFSQDGETLATTIDGGQVTLWDVATRTQKPWVGGIRYEVKSFNPDGTLLATIGRESTFNHVIFVWDVATGEEKYRLGHRVDSVSFSPDRRTLASTGSSGKVRLWSVDTREQIAELTSPERGIQIASFSPDGKTIAGGADDKVYLWDMAAKTINTVLIGHTEGVQSVSFSPDGRTLASGGRDGTVRLWDVVSGRQKAILSGHIGIVTRVSFGRDDKTLASFSREDGSVYMWDLATRLPKFTISGHHGFHQSPEKQDVIFSPDGKTLASIGSSDGAIHLWDVATGRQRAALNGCLGLGHHILRASFSPDSKTLASGGSDHMVRLWDVASGREIAVLKHDWGIAHVSFSPDGETLASRSGNQVRLWDVHDWTEKFVITHTDSIWSTKFSLDKKSKILATFVSDKTLRLWDVATEREIKALTLTGRIRSVSFSPDGETVAGVGSDRTVRLWNVATGGEIGSLEHTAGVGSVSFSPDGKTLASADGTLRLWNLDTLTEIGALTGHRYPIGSVIFSPDGKALASIGGYGDPDEIALWDVETRRIISVQMLPNNSRISISFSPDSKTLASMGYDDGAIYLWDVATGKKKNVRLTQHKDGAHGASFSADSKTLAVAGGSRSDDNDMVRLWNVEDRTEIGALSGHTGPVYSVSFNPHRDSNLLASGGWDGTVRLWDVKARSEIATLTGHTEPVFSVVFSPKGNRLASLGGDYEGELLLWDVEKRTEIPTLPERGERGYWEVRSVSFSPDSEILAGACDDGVVRLWDAEDGAQIDALPGPSEYVTSVSFSPDGSALAATGGEYTDEVYYGAVYLWDVATWTESAVIRMRDGTNAILSFSPDSRTLAYASNNSLSPARLWDIAAEETKKPEFALSPQSVYGVSFSPDGKTLVIGYNNGVRLWDVATRISKATIRTDTNTIDTLIFSPDGRTLVAFDDGSKRLFWFNVPASGAAEDGTRLAADVNGDGAVNIQDLVAVSAALGQTGENGADVNGDGAVNIQDMVAVAAALLDAAAAPSLIQAQPAAGLTAAEVAQWIAAAQSANLTDPTSQRGIRFLHYLLAMLTPQETALLPNYPNPFNPETWMPYRLAAPGEVTLTIRAVDGGMVRSLALGHQPAGVYQAKSRAAYWDGRNSGGETVASGVYFYTLSAGDFSATRKMLIRK